MSKELTVAVLGAGNGAFATAAALKLKGCRVHLLEAPELAEQTIGPLQEHKTIEVVGESGAFPAGSVAIDIVTQDPAQALSNVDIVLYVVPAYAEERFTELCLSHFQPEQLVVLFCGNFGGALGLANQLAARRNKQRPLIAEMEGLAITGFKQNATTVRIGGYKAGLACAALPARDTEEVLRRLRPLFPDFEPVANVLTTSLRNVNPIVHAPVTLLNAGRIAPDRRRWRYYWEGVTAEIGEMVEALDDERLAVANALDLSLPSIQDVLLKWYGSQGAQGATLAEVLSNNPTYEGVWAPQTLEHRFLTEDIPFGLVPIEALGSALGVDTPLCSAYITLASKLLARDFRESGRNLQKLGLANMRPEQIKEVVEVGA